MTETLANNPEKREGIADDARKFIVTDIDPQLLEGDHVVSFRLIVDWLETGEDDEEKVVFKEFPDGKIQRFSVAKVTENGKRTTVKNEISEEEYNKKKSKALAKNVGIEKIRYEFTLKQDGIVFDIKYDELSDPNRLRMLEVDAGDDEERAAFEPSAFQASKLVEVTSDRTYEGYRIAEKV